MTKKLLAAVPKMVFAYCPDCIQAGKFSFEKQKWICSKCGQEFDWIDEWGRILIRLSNTI